MDASDIFDVETRTAIGRLQESFPNHEFQTSHYCYIFENYDFDAASSRLRGLPSKLVHIDQSLRDHQPDADDCKATVTNTGVLPAEIWQMVCSYLDFESLGSLRLTNSGLADIAAERLVKTIHIDASFESLRRLKCIANNDCLRKGVRELTFEGGLLADVGCVHNYMKHFDLAHHEKDKPQQPLKGKGFERAMRLYTRNIAKWEKEVEAKYKTYRKNYEAQQLLLSGPKAHFFECMDRFPNLKDVVLRTDAPCKHMFSQRFRSRFCNDCAIPISMETAPTTWQLEHILRPGVKSLSVRLLSPKFFSGEGARTPDWLVSMFKDLESVQLMFKLEGETLQQLGDSFQHVRMLENGHLASALSKCHNLKCLAINFHPSFGLATGTTLHDALPAGHTFPKLQSLDLDFFTTTEDTLLEVLERQPELDRLCIAYAHLSAGSWPSVIQRMRRKLKLVEFICQGYMEDGDTLYPMDLCDKSAWSDGERITLATCVDGYVTDPDYMGISDDGSSVVDEDEEDLFNPLITMNEDFDEDSELTMTLGPLDEDNDDDDNDVHEDSDMDSLPDLESSSEDAMDVD